MAKIGFTKLGLKLNTEIKTIEFNEQNIEIKQYLPLEEKLELITKVIIMSHDANNFSNPLRVEVYAFLGIIEYYTNINLTQKQKETPTKIYDYFVGSGLKDLIIEAIPEKEYKSLEDGLYESIEAVYKYQNSILGVLDSIQQDYGNAELDLEKLQEKLTDPQQLETIKSLAEFSGFLPMGEEKAEE